MFKKYKKQLIFSSIVILLPIALGLLLWNQLPDSFAAHWGVDGQPDSRSGKAFGVFAPPLFLAAAQWLCVWITDRDNRKKGQHPKVMNLIFWILPALSLLSSGIIYAAALGKTPDISTLMPISLGLMFMFIGNYLPKCKQNTTIGIKVTWTLNNEENWNATHRFAGKIWVAGGVITMFSALLPEKIGFPIMFVSLMGAGAGSALFSYLYYRRQLKLGTAVPTRDIPVDKTAKRINRVVWIIVIAILIGCGFILFTGSIEYDFQEDSLVMDASYYGPLTLRYENIEDIQYREDDVDGTRVMGFGSFRLLLGFFENEEFGAYSRYTYYKPNSCIVVTANGQTLVFSGKDAAETQLLYQELMTRIG